MPPSILRRRLAFTIDPAAAFTALYAHTENAFWLDGGVHAATGMSYLGGSHEVVRCASWAELFAATTEFGGRSSAGGDRSAGVPVPQPDARPAPAFRLGWVGWLAYELGTLDEERAAAEPREPEPRAVFLRVERALEFDHASGAVTLLALDAPGAAEWLDDTEAALALAAAAAAPADVPVAPVLPPASAVPAAPVALPASAVLAETPAPASPIPPRRTASARQTFDDYAALIEECKRVIERGDAYQLCLTNEFSLDYQGGADHDHALDAAAAPTPAPAPDPLETYLRLRAASPTHHGGYLRVGDTALLSASPEQFLAVTTDGTVSTRPIKGTRPRGAGPVDDALLRAELAASEKERAENLMIVDLMRNDLSRVCTLGSVRVTELLRVESYAQVHQLVSTVEGILAPGLTGLDAVAACFPAGSMTGAPKRSAMAHLAALEAGPRGIYSGAFGYLSFDGSIDLAMVIRSIVLTPGRASVGAGGGITALSDAFDEVEETRVKAAALLAVLGAELPDGPTRREHGNL